MKSFSVKSLRVYKYPIAGQLDLPVGAKLVMAETQGGVACAWFVVDIEAPVEARLFRVEGTGGSWNNAEWEHRWTWMEGPFVWHLLEKVKGA